MLRIHNGNELTTALKSGIKTSDFMIDTTKKAVSIPVEFIAASGEAIKLDMDIQLNINAADNRAILNGNREKDVNSVFNILADDPSPFLSLVPLTPRSNAKSASFMLRIRNGEATSAVAVLARISHETLANIGSGIQSARSISQAKLERAMAADVNKLLDF